MNAGERQVHPTIDGIRLDHVNRYKWVIEQLSPCNVIDVACGVGYGSKLMAEAGFNVHAVDIDQEAIEYAKHHYNDDRINYECNDMFNIKTDRTTIAFECIEHVENPLEVLKECGDTLLASVPNETYFPYLRYKYHYRHYTQTEFEDLLNKAGYTVVAWYGQEGAESEVEENVGGRTLLAIAKR